MLLSLQPGCVEVPHICWLGGQSTRRAGEQPEEVFTQTDRAAEFAPRGQRTSLAGPQYRAYLIVGKQRRMLAPEHQITAIVQVLVAFQPIMAVERVDEVQREVSGNQPVVLRFSCFVWTW
jgi:hypothetical protein